MPMTNLPAGYDREADDLGNIVELGHVNVTIPDQGPATLFYVAGLGLTRDPFMSVSVTNMWVNAGRSQFHLPEGPPQSLGGIVELVLPDLAALRARLERVRPRLASTRFDWRDRDGAVETTCPWGNVMRCHAPDEARFGPISLGIASVAFPAPAGSAAGIARFYRDLLGARAELPVAGTARITVGADQTLLFTEAEGAKPPFTGAHVQVSIADFSGPHRRLLERGLVTEESDEHQYRFADIVDPEDGRVLLQLEHEVRSLRHPMFGRALINRNPAQTAGPYRAGRDHFP